MLVFAKQLWSRRGTYIRKRFCSISSNPIWINLIGTGSVRYSIVVNSNVTLNG